MKKYLFLIFIIIPLLASSQSVESLKALALKNAQHLSEATLKQDQNILLQYMHPVIRKKYGDPELLEAMEDTFKTMDVQQIKIINFTINELTEIRKEKKTYHCLITNTVDMNFSGQSVTLKNSLFGFYSTTQKQWHFVESDKLINDDKTQELFPDFKTKISIPKMEQVIK